VLEDASAASVEPIVRGITTAAKSLRLYPATSPIPKEAVATAESSLAKFFEENTELTIKVARGGLSFRGQQVAAGAASTVEFSDDLRDHGVAEVVFLPGVTAAELLTFLAAVHEKPQDLSERGGVLGVLAEQNVATIAVTQVDLHVVDISVADAGDQDIDAFLREVAADPDRLAAWLAAASHGDPAILDAGLHDFARAVGPEGMPALSAALAKAFGAQDHDGQDAVIGLALEPSGTRDILGDVFAQIASRDMAGSLAGGAFGRNMLAMSSALERLPLAERMNDVFAQVKEILPEIGKSAKEMGFLDHMMQVRSMQTPETSLVDAQPTYRQVAQLTAIDEGQIHTARDHVVTSTQRTDDTATVTMLTLLDQETDAQLYARTFEGLAGMVPHLLERGRLDLAGRILAALEQRESSVQGTWPEVAGRCSAAIDGAMSEAGARALLNAVVERPESAPAARELMRRAGDVAMAAFVQQALQTKANGLEAAESIVGRRLLDMLVAYAPKAPAGQVGALVARLGKEGDARPQQAVEAILKRPDELSRREAAAGLAASGGPIALRHLAVLLRDPSPEVATAAIRAVGRSDAPGAAAALGARLAELDVDGKDFDPAREIIGALARVPDPEATNVLTQLAGRKALIKRGHFAEVTALAEQALAQRRGGGPR
jgi:hypothetical protein